MLATIRYVCNEIEWVFENHGVSQDNVYSLVAEVAKAIHDNSSVLVCQGTGPGPKYNSSLYSGNFLSDQALGQRVLGAFLDFYNDHYYDWQNQWFNNPFDKSPADWNMDEKPCLIGECAANTNAGYAPAQFLQRAYSNGWQGIMTWTSNGVDANGDLDDFKAAYTALRQTHENMVFPPSGTAHTYQRTVGTNPVPFNDSYRVYDLLGRQLGNESVSPRSIGPYLHHGCMVWSSRASSLRASLADCRHRWQ